MPPERRGRVGGRRVPVRPGVGPRARRAGGRPAPAAGDRPDHRGRLARRHQDDRRALGRRRALSGGELPRRASLVGLERPVPRRRPPLLARRAGDDLGPGHPALRVRRRLPGPGAAPLDQLHHLPRRVHPARPRQLRHQAQRRQRRGEPRRVGLQLLVELRRRGADRRPRDQRPPGPAGPQPDGDAPDLAGGPDDPRRRRVPPDAGGEQQRLVPGQRGELVRLDPRRAQRRLPPVHPADDRPPEAAPRPPPPDLLSTPRASPTPDDRLARPPAVRARLRARRAAASPSPSTAAAATARARSTATCTSPATPATTRRPSRSPPPPRVDPGAGPSTPRWPAPTTRWASTKGRPSPSWSRTGSKPTPLVILVSEA